MRHTFPVRVPITVELTRWHVVWVDVEPEDTVEDVVQGWCDDPVEMLQPLEEKDAVDYDYTLHHDPFDQYVIHSTGWIGPTFPSGAYSSDEEQRLQEFLKRQQDRRSGHPVG